MFDTTKNATLICDCLFQNVQKFSQCLCWAVLKLYVLEERLGRGERIYVMACSSIAYCLSGFQCRVEQYIGHYMTGHFYGQGKPVHTVRQCSVL